MALNQFKMNVKKVLRAIWSSAKLKKICKDGDVSYFLCARGIGDTVLFCTLLAEFKKNNPNKKIKLIISDSQSSIVCAFKDYYDGLIILPKKQIERLILNQSHNFYFEAENFKYIIPADAIVWLGYKDVRLLDLYRITLGLDENANPFFPEFKVKSINVVDFIREHDIRENRAVILAPHSYSVSETSLTVWNEIVLELQKKGYSVITNAQSGENPLANTISYSGSLSDVCELAQFCGYVVSNRSGLSDLLALLNIILFVVYPDSDSLKRYSFESMNLKANIKEFLFDKTITEQIIQEFH